MSRARGPHSPRHARLEVTSRISMPSPGSRCRAIHARSRLPEAVPVTIGTVRAPAWYRQVALDAAPAVQHLRVHDAPVGHVDVVRADALEERALCGPETSILAKLVSSNSPARSRVATCSATIAVDQCSPAHPRGRSDAYARVLVRAEPVHAPSLPSRRTPRELLEARVGGRDLQRPARSVVLPRVLHVVVLRVDLVGARERVSPAS